MAAYRRAAGVLDPFGIATLVTFLTGVYVSTIPNRLKIIKVCFAAGNILFALARLSSGVVSFSVVEEQCVLGGIRCGGITGIGVRDMTRGFLAWRRAATGVAVVLSCMTAAADGTAIRVATFNIRCPVDKTPNSWEERTARVNGLVAAYGFELMGLQEATARQIDDMLASGWAYVGAGRDDGQRKGEFSCIFYKKARFELGESGTFWLSETPEIPGSKSWNTDCTRICTWARLKDRTTGRGFFFFNTHLDHRSAEARANGMALILKRIGALETGVPVILTGDMNATPGTAPVTKALEVLRDAASVSLVPHKGPSATFNGFRVGQPHTARIDYIFVSPGIRVLSHATLDDAQDGFYPSDHFPVMADVVLE